MRKFEETPALVLCGGLGTLLREETEVRPKPKVPVGSQAKDINRTIDNLGGIRFMGFELSKFHKNSWII